MAKNYFDIAVLVNLERRKDRLADFRRNMAQHDWPLARPYIFAAVDGEKVPPPSYFHSGAGAWGCLRSHINVLEACLMADVKRALVLEDDVVWKASAWPRLDEFMANVPQDWQMLMLGNEHVAKPQLVTSSIVRCRDTRRTHAYAITDVAMKVLLEVWHTSHWHCDWTMGPYMGSLGKCYAPTPPIFGQGAGPSDISGHMDVVRYWG